MNCKVEGCQSPGTTGTPDLCVRHKFANGIRVNGLHRFKNDREMGLTQAARAREMFKDAKADGKDIMKVPGGRSATEKRTARGEWEKVNA